MDKKRPTEQDLLKDLDPVGAHADALSEPMKSLKGSVKKFERPTAPVTDSEDLDAWFDGEGVSGDFMEADGEE